MGVDMFFVLSGFLIVYSLLRECEKTKGEIDYGNFLLYRFWRLWPVLLINEWYIIFFLIVDPSFGIWKFKELFFVSNLDFGRFQPSIIWSVAVEF